MFFFLPLQDVPVGFSTKIYILLVIDSGLFVFACEGVFGDLPKEFLDKFSSVNGDHLVCRPKPNNFTNTKAGGSNYFNNLLSNDGKRMASTSGAQANKKQKTSYDSSSWVFPQVTKNHKGGGNSSGRGKFRGRGQKRS